MLTLVIPLMTHHVRRILLPPHSRHIKYTETELFFFFSFFFKVFLTFNLPNSARSRSGSKPLEGIRIWVNSTEGLSHGQKGGFCPYIIQVFFHDSCRYSMHGSRAGHTALCKNDLQPCQRSLPLPLYYTHLTRRGLQHAHARTPRTSRTHTNTHTHRKTERETDSVMSLEVLIEFCVDYDCVTFNMMSYKWRSLFMVLGFHLFFHPRCSLRIF